MSYRAMDIASYVVTKCINDRKPISNLQLQKILYRLQIVYNIKKNKILIEDDFEAWQFGPVIPIVYYRFCSNGANPITFFWPNTEFELKEEIKEIIDPVIIEKRKVKPWKLVDETHKKGGAWDIVYNNGLGNREIIEKSLIFSKG